MTAFYWYRQSAGDSLKLIRMPQKTSQYEPEPPTSRFSATYTENSSNLTIFTTVQEDEGMYHCAHRDWQEIIWSGTYLSIKGNSERESSYTVVQRPTLPHPSHKADSDTLQCSLLSDSEIPTCSAEPSVFWFRASSVKSFPDIIYTDGNGFENCEKTSDSQKRCVYNFSKNVSSYDAGTYYCAVATCGRILFGNGADLQMDEAFEIKMLVVTVICLIISVIINIIFICCQTQRCAYQQYKGMT
ncbi:uncharacterized protein LOC118557512 [Fundulus heteroclitus]|uniref:uncharacterized protein LOC118557512 n=1 Tax=Fundulus heteroclitus TaxID=8078 RepID=UPI00165C3B5B|nr:uncharacterized protein LOC118557512 [Fundulus heteroclitus]